MFLVKQGFTWHKHDGWSIIVPGFDLHPFPES